jgi:hypothetical protein
LASRASAGRDRICPDVAQRHQKFPDSVQWCVVARVQEDPPVPEAITGDQHWQAALAREERDAADWCREHGLP